MAVVNCPERSDVLDLLRRVRASTIGERLTDADRPLHGGATRASRAAFGERVISWELLVRDIMGTLGWRPDALTRLEASYPDALAAAKK